MRSDEDYQRILELWRQGYNKLQIARLTAIPRETVRDCIHRYNGDLACLEADVQCRADQQLLSPETWGDNYRKTYAYLLALYLGDGCITFSRQTPRLRISLDNRYPHIINQCKQAIEIICPQTSTNIIRYKTKQSVEVSNYSGLWLRLFPQHGAGEKHKRKLELEAWQQEIVREYPIEFLRGFIHSDGCRIEPVINGKIYARYQFTNLSEDIQRFFADTCALLDVHWTFHGRNFTIAKRKDVAFLDRVIGPKR